MKKKLLKVSLVALASLSIGACTTTVNDSKTDTARQQLAVEGIPFSPQALSHFASEGNIAKAQQFLDAGMDINAAAGGVTALTAAVAYQKTGMVNYLISRGADVNIRTYHGTPLSITAWNGNADIANMLLKNGANPNVAVLDGATPLMIAAFNDRAEVIKILVENGAKIDYAHPVTSFTALIVATYYGKKNAAIALINLGANVNYIDANGLSSLDWSQIGAYDDITKALVANGAKVEMKENNEVPYVMLAVLAHENLPMIDFLVNKGINVNGLANGKMPILIWCAKSNVPNSAIELIKLGADTSVKDIDGHTALDWAIIFSEKKLAQTINPKIDVSKLDIPKDPNVQNQATLVGELINDQYYQGTVTSVQNLESALSSKSISSDTSLMKDLRSDKVFKNPAIKADTSADHPEWETVNEFENFDKQIQADMQLIDRSLNLQPGVVSPSVNRTNAVPAIAVPSESTIPAQKPIAIPQDSQASADQK